jgi:hypothetical protein
MINKALNHLEELLVTFLMGAATLIIFASVAHRYMAGVEYSGLQDWLLTLNFGWAQELCIIMFVWMAKFGAAYGVRTGIHVGVDVLINRLEDNMRASSLFLACCRVHCSPASWPRSVPTLSGKTARTTPFSNFLGIAPVITMKGRLRLTSSGRPGSYTAQFRWVPH